MKNLPIGTQSFETLRSTDCVYVDKTENIYRMVMNGRIYFLSRPRRFGKSLLISTLEALFKGKKELFEGLYIYDKWDWSQQHPVVRIDWTLIDHSTPEKIEISLIGYLERLAQNYQVILTEKSAPNCFGELIDVLHEKTGQKVVVLIDEYDKPVTSHLFDSQLDAVRTAVHDFYQVLKGSDEHLQFLFLTGVSKFSGLSVFSALNHLNDISLHEQFASICGYTQEELENSFPDYLENTAEHLEMTKEELLNEIRYWYDGYTWDGKTSIYNPFATLRFFSAQEFTNYWFATGTPTFLIDIIQRRNAANIVLEPFVVDSGTFGGYDPSELEEVPLLFQTGYLTIKRKERFNGIPRYTLDVPNSEVREAFSQSLLNVYGKYHGNRIYDLRMAMEQ
jgi:hypothetical protein